MKKHTYVCVPGCLKGIRRVWTTGWWELALEGPSSLHVKSQRMLQYTSIISLRDATHFSTKTVRHDTGGCNFIMRKALQLPVSVAWLLPGGYIGREKKKAAKNVLWKQMLQNIGKQCSCDQICKAGWWCSVLWTVNSFVDHKIIQENSLTCLYPRGTLQVLKPWILSPWMWKADSLRYMIKG